MQLFVFLPVRMVEFVFHLGIVLAHQDLLVLDVKKV